MNLIVLGAAGSGKTLFTKNFGRFLSDLGYSVRRINLDPASRPRYGADRDIREFIRTEEVMEREKLGINGALIRSAELSIKYFSELILDADYVIYDTPGQLELFIFTNFGTELVKRLGSFTVGIFLVDSSRIINPNQYAAMISQSAVITLLLQIPVLTVFNKSDLHELKDFDFYKEELEKEGVLGEFFDNLLKFIEGTSVIYRPLKISAKNFEGFNELLNAINEVFCSCGDLS
uniref:GTPase n=1 Tax=Geoglobus ahangari TaxID=113653 RepID=A0A7C3YDA3_9EURY